MKQRTLAFVLLSLFTLSLLTGCNTMRGAGQDIEDGGKAVQDAAS